MLRLMRAVAREWRTVGELREAVGMDAGSLRDWLGALARDGALRMRHRPHEMREDGDKPSGPRPREYRLNSKWSDLR
jgi:DNA-binding transcriptional ArsR family regulator